MKLQLAIVDKKVRAPVKRWILRVGVPATVLISVGAVAYADPLKSWKSGEELTAKDLNDNFANVQQQLDALVPPGTIIAYGGEIDANPIAGAKPKHPPPSGWLLCNGDPLNGAVKPYDALYAAIGVNYGGSATSQSFNLPDLRGLFLRGVDGGKGRDKDATDTTDKGRFAMNTGGNVGDQVGSMEGDSFAAHDHGGITGDDAPDHAHGYARPTGGSWGGGSGSLVSVGPDVGQTTGGATVRHRHSIAMDGRLETRPINANVNWIIKY